MLDMASNGVKINLAHYMIKKMLLTLKENEKEASAKKKFLL